MNMFVFPVKLCFLFVRSHCAVATMFFVVVTCGHVWSRSAVTQLWPFLSSKKLRFLVAVRFSKQKTPLLSSPQHRVRARRRVTKHKNLWAAPSSVSSLVNNRTWISSFLAANPKQTPRNLQHRLHTIDFVNLAKISASGQIASDVIYIAP